MKILLTIIILALLGWGIYAFVNKDKSEVPNSTPPVSQEAPSPTPPVATSTVREFMVVGKNFSLSPGNLEVNKGDRVRITLQNQGGTHDWVIDEFNARTKVLSNGQTETIEFVADKIGTFEYYCSVGTHRQMGMKGTLVVK